MTLKSFSSGLCGILLLVSSASSFAAVDLDGVSDCLFTASTVNFGTNIITISFWAKFNSTDADSITIELTTNYNNNARAFILNWYDSLVRGSCDGSALMLGMRDTGAGDYRLECMNSPPSTGEWHHYSAIYDNLTTNGDIKLYVDGIEQGLSLGATPVTDATGNFPTATLYIGDRACAGGGGLDVNGILEEFYIHVGELSANEILLLANSRIKKIGMQINNTLLRYWSMDDYSDGTDCNASGYYKDYSSNAGHLTPSATAGQIPTGTAGRILSYP